MEQLDTLFLLKEKFETDVMERGLDPTIKMEKAIRGKCDCLFHLAYF